MPLQPDPRAVFLNIPYDEEFRDIYVAYIVGLFQLGLVPHIASEIPGGERRLNRIFALIKSCRYSIHDLSRVEVSVAPSATPRFNMPLELGMTITWAILRPKLHTWFVWESEPYRLLRSASDLNGTDPYIHKGTVEGVLSELLNAFTPDNAPSVEHMLTTCEVVFRVMPQVMKRSGTQNVFAPSVFKELCVINSRFAEIDRKTESPGNIP